MGVPLIAWIDVETSGDSPEEHPLLEVACHMTDFLGNPQGENYQTLVKVGQLSEVIENTAEHIRTMHDRSGLWRALWEDDAKDSRLVDLEAQRWLSSFPEASVFYFGGNSIRLDRNFIQHNLPAFYRCLSHRSIDVTSLSLLFQNVFGAPGYHKGSKHRALADALDAAQEYRHYLHWLFTHGFIREDKIMGTIPSFTH